MIPCTSLRSQLPSDNFADGVVRHGERKVQAPIEFGLVAAGQGTPHRGGKLAQMIDLAVPDAVDRRYRFNRRPDHEARRGRVLAVEAEAAAQRRPDQCAENGIDAGAAAAVFLRRPKLIEALAIAGDAAGDEQLRDQFVLGAEVVIHRGEIDIRLSHDVAQRHVAKTAIGVKPFGGGENRGSGMIARHGLREGSCISNVCMKLSFEAGNVNPQAAVTLQMTLR
jgi:hypothetical protein